VHINDTHPALCVPEFMRLLVDDYGVGWNRAWDTTVKVMSYTNHTILSEALEKWPEEMVKQLLPRIYQIIVEIDRRRTAEL
ncbi:glycogen/starch/alpha-glucan phosphorylase, partial [Lactobacillus murinus]